jgi:hypothetical protein
LIFFSNFEEKNILSMSSNQKITVKEINRLYAMEAKYAKLLEFTKGNMKRLNKQASRPSEYWIKNMFGTLAVEIEQKLQEIDEFSESESESESE